LSSTGFVGRISYTLTLEELPLSDCNRFWPSDISAYEKFKLLSVTGGIPKYLEAGCQLDYMIQMKYGTLYVCEIKFSKNEIGHSIIPEVQAKIDALSRPKGMSCRPALIHVNGVSQDVVDSDYFASIIDMSDLLLALPSGIRYPIDSGSN
jgi:hypothetical protein